MAFVLLKNKPWGDRVECKDRLEREMLKEKGSRRAQIPADDKQWISVCLSRGPSEILHCTFSDLWLGLILYLKRLLFSPSTLFFFFFLPTFLPWYIKGRWNTSKFHTAQKYLLSTAWPRTQRAYSCKRFDPPIHKISDQIVKVCVAEMYLLPLLSHLKLGCPWSSCLSVLPCPGSLYLRGRRPSTVTGAVFDTCWFACANPGRCTLFTCSAYACWF